MNIYLQNETETEQIVDSDTGTTDAAKVILYNDEYHTFDEVIVQLVKAISCSADEAESIAWEVHTKGKSMVYEGEMPDCLRVSAILEEIALHTQIEY
jgi:ATP-dependent Clp protease adapter protein ClpS